MSLSSSAIAMRMSILKLYQLKHWAFLTGLPLSGRKADLQENLRRDLEQVTDETRKTKRIVSVDMGIRNLAFCAVDTPPSQTSPKERVFMVDTWKRMDLTKLNLHALESPADENPEGGDDSEHKCRKKGDSVDTSMYAPSSLAKIAASLTRDLSAYSPDTILIERQRFRTSGQAAIQEWTVRVNMLEAMLWASFETLRPSSPAPASLHSVSPARVANFWSAGKTISLSPPPDLFSSVKHSENAMYDIGTGSRRVDKQEKVDIVRSWIAGHSDVRLAFTEQTANIAASFERTSGNIGKSGKLDDLADCLLQAIAWAWWEENQRSISAQWTKAVADIGDSNR